MDSTSAGVTDAAADVDSACDELIARWRRGDRVGAEVYLRARPGLDPAGDSAFDLIYAEYLVREELGEEPDFEEFLRRFPEQEAVLRRQVLLHKTIGDFTETESPFATTLPSAASPAYRPAPAGYVIEREVGRGGMGVVYEARQLRLDRTVALKMIRAGGHATSEDTARLLGEAGVIARFQHPNIVQVHAVGDCDGQPFFEMEYVAGGSLAARLDGIPRPPREVSRLIETVARAIHQAHLRGIIHRDLKPANILLTPEGVPKVADFGLAKLLDADSGLTRTDSVLGSPGYMAPEQADGRARDAGPAADVYALGAIYYELITGRPPFRAPTALETLDLVRNAEPIRPSYLRLGLPRDVETIALKCLEKDPSRRYASAEALADDLGRFLRGEAIQARPIGPVGRASRWAGRNRAVASLAAAVLLLVTGGFAGMAGLWAHASRQAYDARQQRDEVRRLSAGLALDRGLELARSGRAARGLHWMAETLRIPVADSAVRDAARADLAAWAATVPAPVATIAKPPGTPSSSALSPDGRSFVLGGHDGVLTLCKLDERRAIPLSGSHEAKVSDIAFSPDGGRFITCGADGTLRAWRASDGAPLGPPARLPAPVIGVIVADATRLVAFYGSSMQPLDLDTLAPIGPHVDLNGSMTDKAVDRARSVLAVTTDRGALCRFDPRTFATVAPASLLSEWAASIDISPDGRRYVLGFGESPVPGEPARGTGARIFDAARAEPVGVRIPRFDGQLQVRYGPDGRRLLAFGREGFVQVFDEEGTPVGTPIRCEGVITNYAFSPDGQLALIGTSGGAAILLNARDGRQIGSSLELSGHVRVAFRPDGRTIVLAGDRAVRCLDVAEVAAPSARLHRDVQSAGYAPGGLRYTTGRDGSARLWDADGRPVGLPLVHRGNVRAIAFRESDGLIATGADDSTVRLWTARGLPVGPPIRQTHWVYSLAFSRDGRRLLVGRVDNTAQLFDVATGAKIGPPLRHPRVFPGNSVRFVAMLRQADMAVSVSNDGTIGRVDARTGEPIGPFQTLSRLEEGIAEDTCLSPDGRTLLVVSGGSAHLIDAATGERRLAPQGRGLLAGAFLPDGRAIVTGGEDRRVQVRDIATGRPIGDPMEHDQPVRTIVVSPDGRSVATVTQEGRVQLWDVASHKPIGPPRRHDFRSARPQFSPDGRTLALAFGAAEFLPIPSPETAEDLASDPTARTGLAMDERGAFTPVVAVGAGAAAPPIEEATWHRRAADSCEARGEWDAALGHLDRLIRDEPGEWWHHARRARVLARMGRTTEAEAAAARARALTFPDQAAEWDAHRAVDAEADSRPSEAADGYSRALGRWPDHDAFRTARATIRARVGDWAGAALDLRKGTPPNRYGVVMLHAVVFGRAGDTAAYRTLCEALLRSQARKKAPLPPAPAWLVAIGPGGTDDYSALIEQLDPSVRAGHLEPDDPPSLAALLYRAGRFEEAIGNLERLPVAGGRRRPEVLAFLAMAHARLGHRDEAVRLWDEIRIEGPRQAEPFDSLVDALEIRFLLHEAEVTIFGPDLPGNVFAR